MANKNVEKFIQTYGPVAVQVSKEINVDPNILLGQWGLESRWGQTEMAKKYHNLGGIKDFSGQGFEAKDNKTGSVDKYVKFEDPEVFGMYYADQIKRNFPGAMNTGPDAGAFTRGLASGKRGSYFEVPQERYLESLTGAQAAIPSDKVLPFEPTEVKPPAAATGDDDMVTVDAPPSTPPKPDTSGASPGERFLGGALGTGVGVASTGAQAFSSARTAAAAKRAGAEERARIAAQRAAAAATPPAPGAAPAAAPGTSIMRQPAAGGPLSNVQPTGSQATRILQGTIGDEGTTGRARATGFNTQTAQEAAQQKELQRMFSNLQRTGAVADDASTFFARQPGMTATPSGVLMPRSEAPVTLGPRGPQGQIGFTRPPAPPPPAPPAPPSLASRAASGLDQVGDMFKGMMRPIGSGLATVGRYALPPLAGLSAGLDVAEMAHEYDKPADQRDYTKMGLKGMGVVGGALSMFPPTMPLGLGLSLAAPALEYAREKGVFGEKPEQAQPAP